jgi:hypothetical protein
MLDEVKADEAEVAVEDTRGGALEAANEVPESERTTPDGRSRTMSWRGKKVLGRGIATAEAARTRRVVREVGECIARRVYA